MKYSIKIIFDRDDTNPVFYPTQMVSGTVELAIERPVKAKGLRLTIQGTTKMFWSVGANYTGLEEHMHYSTYLIGQANGESREITTGKHIFGFSSQIPADVPASISDSGWSKKFFLGISALIEYKINVTLDVSWNIQIIAEREFVVKREEDLNLYPELNKVSHFQETIPLNNLCCKTKSVQIKIRVPKVGYALKEKIPFTIDVAGVDGRFPVKKIQIKLLCMKICVSQKPEERVFMDMETSVKTLIPFVVESDVVHIQSSIDVPETCPVSNRKYGKLFYIDYLLEFIFLSDGCEKSAIILIPITIGTVSIHQE